jgi:hypothetical protein
VTCANVQVSKIEAILRWRITCIAI